jgi:hypothetical protein
MSSCIRSITHVRTHKLLQACGRLMTKLLPCYKLGRSEASEVGGGGGGGGGGVGGFYLKFEFQC